MAHKKIPTRSHDRLETERRLIRAAEDVFAEHGYEGGSTRLIAEKADVNLGLISRYFGNKRGLLLAVLEDLFSSVSMELPYPPATTLEEELDKYIRFSCKDFLEREALSRITIIQSITDPSLLLELRKRPSTEKFLSPTSAYINENTVQRFAKHFSMDPKKDDKVIRNYLVSIDYVILGIFMSHYFMMRESKKTILAICKTAVKNMRIPSK